MLKNNLIASVVLAYMASSALSTMVFAQDVYEQVDRQGNITFTDNPSSPNATKVDLPTGSTAPGKSQTPSVEKTEAKSSQTKSYTTLEITSPTDQESIQNQPTLSVDVKLDPPLQSGDRIQLYLDGKAWGEAGTSTHFSNTTPERGQHTLSAAIFDANLQRLKESAPVTIYVHQAHL